jgi:hypothetical protein
VLAGKWADNMLEAVEKDPKNLVLVIADMARSEPAHGGFLCSRTYKAATGKRELCYPSAYVDRANIIRKRNYLPASWYNRKIRKQAADQVSISNSISSLRFLSNTDWRDFVENTSVVEQTLSKDIDGIYSAMDFHTRDNYRHVVEKIAKCSDFSELEVAANRLFNLPAVTAQTMMTCACRMWGIISKAKAFSGSRSTAKMKIPAI